MSTIQPPMTIGQMEADGSSWPVITGFRVGMALPSLINQFASGIQFSLPVTPATGSYEKCGLLVQGAHSDPSIYPGIDTSQWSTKDGVAVSGTTEITPGNLTGRAWGFYGCATVLPDADGLAIAAELGLDNRAVDQPLLDQTNSKVVLPLIAGEGPEGSQFPITAFAVMGGGSSTSHMGIVGDRTAFVDKTNAPVFSVRNTNGSTLSGLLADGSVLATCLTINPIESPILPTEQMKRPGWYVWGDTTNGITYAVYFDGGNYLGLPLQFLGHA